MSDHLPKRKQTRWNEYDYSNKGAYFITICTNGRKQILSHIPAEIGVTEDAQQPNLTSYGKIAEDCINQIGNFYEDIKIDQFVIMPNHIHLILFVYGNEPKKNARQHSLVSKFVSTLKRFCNKQYGENIWQRSYFDHIIRDKTDYQTHIRYIAQNPLKWNEDEFFF